MASTRSQLSPPVLVHPVANPNPMHTEYGDIDSDYVFVNLWSGRNQPGSDLHPATGVILIEPEDRCQMTIHRRR